MDRDEGMAEPAAAAVVEERQTQVAERVCVWRTGALIHPPHTHRM